MLELVYKYLDTGVDTMYNRIMSMKLQPGGASTSAPEGASTRGYSSGHYSTNQADFHMLMQIEERAANGLFDCCEDCLNTCIVYKAKDASLDCRMFNPRGGK